LLQQEHVAYVTIKEFNKEEKRIRHLYPQQYLNKITF